MAPPGGATSYPADFDGDGDVDGGDLARWKTGFGLATGATKGQGNADGDADVDGDDFLVWQRQLTDAGGAATAARAPEPGTCPLLALALLALRRRRGHIKCPTTRPSGTPRE